jgi:hypothetical protein
LRAKSERCGSLGEQIPELRAHSAQLANIEKFISHKQYTGSAKVKMLLGLAMSVAPTLPAYLDETFIPLTFMS